MREILFRGKRVDDGAWVYGYYVHQYGAFMIYVPREPDDEPYFDYYHVIPETVGQYIGLTDENGKKVFEGDIMARIKYDGTELVEGVVEYGKFNCTCCDGVYGWYVKGDGDIRDLDDAHWLHVCGNIHDTPEKVK